VLDSRRALRGRQRARPHARARARAVLRDNGRSRPPLAGSEARDGAARDLLRWAPHASEAAWDAFVRRVFTGSVVDLPEPTCAAVLELAVMLQRAVPDRCAAHALRFARTALTVLGAAPTVVDVVADVVSQAVGALLAAGDARAVHNLVVALCAALRSHAPHRQLAAAVAAGRVLFHTALASPPPLLEGLLWAAATGASPARCAAFLALANAAKRATDDTQLAPWTAAALVAAARACVPFGGSPGLGPAPQSQSSSSSSDTPPSPLRASAAVRAPGETLRASLGPERATPPSDSVEAAWACGPPATRSDAPSSSEACAALECVELWVLRAVPDAWVVGSGAAPADSAVAGAAHRPAPVVVVSRAALVAVLLRLYSVAKEARPPPVRRAALFAARAVEARLLPVWEELRASAASQEKGAASGAEASPRSGEEARQLPPSSPMRIPRVTPLPLERLTEAERRDSIAVDNARRASTGARAPTDSERRSAASSAAPASAASASTDGARRSAAARAAPASAASAPSSALEAESASESGSASRSASASGSESHRTRESSAPPSWDALAADPAALVRWALREPDAAGWPLRVVWDAIGVDVMDDLADGQLDAAVRATVGALARALPDVARAAARRHGLRTPASARGWRAPSGGGSADAGAEVEQALAGWAWLGRVAGAAAASEASWLAPSTCRRVAEAARDTAKGLGEASPVTRAAALVAVALAAAAER
jgi:hypothetical protein